MILPIMIILIAALFYNQMGKLYTQILRLVRLKLIQNQRKKRRSKPHHSKLST
ncbi:putative transmembrane protein [Moraxella catarrhalis]|nr:putative transmembrane protein [Moraxella catarrhalis]